MYQSSVSVAFIGVRIFQHSQNAFQNHSKFLYQTTDHNYQRTYTIALHCANKTVVMIDRDIHQ